MAETAVDRSARRRFMVACGVLSRRVRAEAERMAAAQFSRSAQAAEAEAEAAESASSSTMLLIPGADVAQDVRAKEPAGPATSACEDTRAQAQLTIVYDGRVLVFDGVAADRAAELMCVAARDAPGGGGLADDMMPVARKASLQRFMEKRRDRLGARAPYAAAARPASLPTASKKTQQEEVGDSSGCWLGLAISGGCAP